MAHHEPRPRVAVVTVSYRSDDVLPGFLASIPVAWSGAVQTVIADNDPSSRVERIADDSGAIWLPLAGNPGYGGAVNAAVATLDRSIEWILVANPDVVLGESSVDVLVETGDSDARIGAVGPAVRDSNGAIYPSARRVPSLRTGIGHALFAGLWRGNPWSRAYHEESSPYRREAGWLSGSCVLVRRVAFERVGGFDPGYFMYFEDVDLGFRLGKDGWANVYEPGASVVHAGAHSTRSDAAAMVTAHHRSAARFVSLKYRGRALAPVRLVIRVGLAARSRIIRLGSRRSERTG